MKIFQFENGIIHSNTVLYTTNVFINKLFKIMQWETVNEINRSVIHTPKTEEDIEANDLTSAVINRSAAMNCHDQYDLDCSRRQFRSHSKPQLVTPPRATFSRR